jgi:HSP20 family protein
VDPEQIEITIHDDLLTIRGVRETNREINEDDWFYQECYWGAFSRSIVLPLDVFPERAEATVKNGILEIRFPIRGKSYRLPIKTIEA